MNTIKKPNAGAYIKAVRTAKGLSADDIARACHVNRSTVFRWENGDTAGIKYPCILAISKLLDIPPEALFGYWHPDIDEDLSTKERKRKIRESVSGMKKQELQAVYMFIKSIKGDNK